MGYTHIPQTATDRRKIRMKKENAHPRQRGVIRLRVVAVLTALLAGLGAAACGDDVDELTSFAEYVGATGEVLDANGIEPETDIDCEGSTDTNDVTCTGTTTEGLSIESTGENLGEDSATLVVTVDGEILYDGLLDEAP
jgi:hypothetical protein